MTLLRNSLLLLPLLAVACEGPAGIDGTNGTDATDGTNGTDGADGSAIASATLAPGEFLSLEHGLGEGDKFYEAQFSWNGVIYDHRDYATLRPGHTQDGAWFSSDELDSFNGDVAAAVLTSGELVVVQQGYVEAIGESIFIIENRDLDGNVLASIDVQPASWSDGSKTGNADRPVVVALGDGGFVVFVEMYTYDLVSYESIDAIVAYRYDSAGTLTTTDTYGEFDGDKEYDSVYAIPTADGGFAAIMGGSQADDGEGFTEIVTWSPTSGAADFPLDSIDGQGGKLAELDDGRMAILVERKLSEDAPDGIDLLLAQPDGTLDAEIRLQNSYITYDTALVVGSQGTILVAAESGGPDLPFYAIVDTGGNIVLPATGMSGWENDSIQAAAFPDGDFFIMVTEDDSNAPMTWAIDAEGALLRPMVIGDITVVPDDAVGAFLPSDGNTIAHLAPSYDSDSPPYLSTYTKGLLQLRVESEDEARLYNETPDTLDVTMVVHRTP